MGTRVHNLEAELFKREKGPLGSKWARKLVVVDGAKRTIRYHKPNEDKRKTPRKIFRLANMSLAGPLLPFGNMDSLEELDLSSNGLTWPEEVSAGRGSRVGLNRAQAQLVPLT